MAPRPGQRTPIWIGGGFTFVRKPRIDAPRFLAAEETVRARNGKLYAYTLQPEAGWPTVLTKLTLPISWSLMKGADVQTANDIVAIRGPHDVCWWKEISEPFAFLAGESFGGYLTRRNALTVVTPLPTNAATLYPVSARRGDGTALTVALGTPDADGVTPWTAAGTSTGETVVVRYTPVFRMRVAEGQPTFPQPQVEGNTLTFEEL